MAFGLMEVNAYSKSITWWTHGCECVYTIKL